jgi:ribosomal protein L25 (general stress protein Ctc)
MKTVWKSSVILAVVAVLPLLSGCVAVLAGAAGAGTVAWVQGRLDAALDANYDKAEKAVNLAITQMEFAKVSEKKDVLNAILIARTAEDKKIEIKVSRVGDVTSRVQIRVGVFGNEAQSLAILDKIKANL